MNITAIIRLKEKIATSSEFTPTERDFILASINVVINMARGTQSGLSDEAHAAGRTKAGNDIGGL